MGEQLLITGHDQLTRSDTGSRDIDDKSIDAQPGVDGREDFFLDVITDVCNTQAALVEGWRIEPRSKGSDLWITLHKDWDAMPSQGWKLHISAAPLFAERVLRRALSVLLAEDAAFKVISSIPGLVDFNLGIYGLSQIGKFITVYPNSDEQALRLAVAVDKATHGLRGPSVPSDNVLRPGSLVHYRYGSFLKYSANNGHAEPQLGMQTPDGEIIPDLRGLRFSPPDWAVDPLAAAGISTPPGKPSPLIKRRYLLTSRLQVSARGEVHIAIDLANSASCVVKRSLRNGAMGIDGTDARDRTRNEAAILGRLAPDPRFPALIELFEQDDDLYLALELVEGQTLLEYVRALAFQGRHLSPGQIAAWGGELASMLGLIHSKGFLYRDLKSSNVFIAPDGKVRLIDFDICQPLDSPTALYSPGTVGYISWDQRSNEAPRLAHDIYSFGALLYFMVTGAEPSNYSRPYSLLDRPVEAMNPETDPGLAAIIARCLQPDPEQRFGSMAELEQALSDLQLKHSDQSAGSLNVPVAPAIPQPDERDHYQVVARQLADALCVAVERHEGNELSWVTMHNPVDHISSRNISTGMAGTALALLELGAGLHEPRYLEMGAKGMQWLVEAPPTQGPVNSGLYTGEAGIAAALLRAGQLLGAKHWIEQASVRARRVADLPYGMPALFSGTAGRLRTHLLLWDETGEPEQLSAALQAGDSLLACGEHLARSMLRWVIPAGYDQHSGRAYTSYSIGATGIADALLDLFEATGEERFLTAAQDAARWIKSLAAVALDDDSGLEWPPAEGDALQGAHWGHGAAGISLFFLHADRLGVVPSAARFARKAARTAALGARWSGPTYGYGLTGNVNCLLDAYQAYGDPEYVDSARSLARLLEAWSVERDGFEVWPTESPAIFTSGYIVGNAGVALCFLRLGDPGRLPAQLSRANFRDR